MSSFFRSVSDSDSSSSDEEEELTDSGSDSGLDAKVSTKKSGKKAKGSDDDSDSDSDSDDSDSDDEDDKVEVKKPAGSRFLRGAASDDSDSDDERAKVVKSAKAKRADEVEACIKSIDNATKINDWSAISDRTRISAGSVNMLADFEIAARRIRQSGSSRRAFRDSGRSRASCLHQSTHLPRRHPRCRTRQQEEDERDECQSAQLDEAETQKDSARQRGAHQEVQGGVFSLQSVLWTPILTSCLQDPEAFERAAVAEEAPAPKLKVAKKDQQVGDADDDDFQTVGNKGKAIAISSEGIYKALAQVLEARGRKVRSVSCQDGARSR